MSYSFNWYGGYFWIRIGSFLLYAKNTRLNKKLFSERTKAGKAKYIDIGYWLIVMTKES